MDSDTKTPKIENQHHEPKTYRFNVSNVLYSHMIDFAELHKFEEKKVLKENYEKWMETKEINELIEIEESILLRQNYDLSKTSIRTKIFKSIKYYLIKNMLKKMQMDNDQTPPKTHAKETGDKPKNIVFARSFINKVKEYLKTKINDPEFKPSTCFENFKKDHEELITDEFNSIYEKYQDTYEMNDVDLDHKLKKMFKNQYFTQFKAATKI